MPQPMSTPTAAGMIAPRVGMTDPTVAPLPRCASGINARCGKMNGILLARTACSAVLSSRIDAQEMHFRSRCLGIAGLLFVGAGFLAVEDCFGCEVSAVGCLGVVLLLCV